MKNIFEHMGKVPYRIVLDNLSSAVAHMGKGHERTLTEGFKRFMTHYKFEAAFCNGSAGWENCLHHIIIRTSISLSQWHR